MHLPPKWEMRTLALFGSCSRRPVRNEIVGKDLQHPFGVGCRKLGRGFAQTLKLLPKVVGRTAASLLQTDWAGGVHVGLSVSL